MACSDGSFPVAEMTRTCMPRCVTGQIDGSGTGRGGGDVGPSGELGIAGGATGPTAIDSTWSPTQAGPSQMGPTGDGGSGSRPSCRPAAPALHEVPRASDPRPQAKRTETTAVAMRDRGAFTAGLLLERKNESVFPMARDAPRARGVAA